MDPNCLTLTQDAFNAHMLRGVMDATGQPGETAQDAQMRCAAIVEIFRTFESANPMEGMIACQCISLRFLLDAAMRDAGAVDLDPALRIRLRASAMAISKNLHVWMGTFTSLHARNEARAAEATQRAGQPEVAARPAKPQPAVTRPAPMEREQSRAMAALVTKPMQPFVVPMAGPDQSTRRPAEQPNQSMKQALLSSVAMSVGGVSNGRLSPSMPPPTR